MGYASFLKRVAASLIDGFICWVIATSINWGIALVALATTGAKSGSGEDTLVNILFLCVSVALWVAYYAWPESSSWQATIGKHLMGLRVTDKSGRRISFWRSVWRNFAKWFSAIILYIGFLMCIWTAKKQCLHDMMAECLVLDEHPGEKEGCAWAVVLTAAALVIIASGIVVALVFGFLSAFSSGGPH